ncbi:hypothetical protein [Bradyrhizobium japonicum]|uniref:hypothetical protein n=2 Tax=Pseudomonadota TaxID=1224 RepID=UPI0012BD122B|nr:hypothetical protein [Bradyrhizobium japonicum]
MSNVVNFREQPARDQHSSGSARPEGGLGESSELTAKLSELASRLVLLKSEAKEEMRRGILLLELTSQNARVVAHQISDPLSKKCFENKIEAAERLLAFARAKLLSL